MGGPRWANVPTVNHRWPECKVSMAAHGRLAMKTRQSDAESRLSKGLPRWRRYAMESAESEWRQQERGVH